MQKNIPVVERPKTPDFPTLIAASTKLIESAKSIYRP